METVPHPHHHHPDDLPKRDAGVRIIVFYKAIKAVAQVLAGLTLGFFVLRGNTNGLERWAHLLTQNVTNAAAFAVAKLILSLVSPHILKIATVALFCDAALSGVEAWALHERFWWSPWLIVLTTSALIPFEVMHLLRHVRIGRALLLIVNLAVVAYLVFRALREMQHERNTRAAAPPAAAESGERVEVTRS